MKLYDGGLRLYWNPLGANVLTAPPRAIALVTAQSAAGNASFSQLVPAGAAVLALALPHASVTVAGAVSCTTAHR